jgi:hypothetical protein
MRHFFIMLTIGFLLQAAADEYTMGRYKLETGTGGAFTVYHDGNMLGKQNAFSAHDTQRDYLFNMAVIKGTLSERKDKDRIVLTWKAAKPGVFDDFTQILTLTSDGLTWQISGTPLADIFDATCTMLAPEAFFSGAPYFYTRSSGQRVRQTLSLEPPAAAIITLPGLPHDIKSLLFKTEIGIVELVYAPPNASVGDGRANPKFPFFFFNTWMRNIKAGQELARSFTLRVLPATAFPTDQ